MAQHFEGDTKKFTITAFLSFAIVFCVLILFMQCHGDYISSASQQHSGSGTEHKVTTHSSDSTHHSDTSTHHSDSTAHGKDSSKENHGSGEHK